MDPDFVLDFAARCDGSAELPFLVTAFRDAIRSVGFDASAGGGWIRSGALDLHRFYFNDWPAAWATLYQELTQIERDLVVVEAGRRMRPFLVSDIRKDPVLARASHRILTAYDAFGWRDVFVVPIHGPSGYGGLVALATMRAISLSGPLCSALELMAIALHRRCRETLEHGLTQPPIARLTSRQTECLRWSSVGKTDEEIGKLVGIRPATVHFHIEQAKRRLGVATRAAALAQAILSGQL